MFTNKHNRSVNITRYMKKKMKNTNIVQKIGIEGKIIDLHAPYNNI